MVIWWLVRSMSIENCDRQDLGIRLTPSRYGGIMWWNEPWISSEIPREPQDVTSDLPSFL